MIVHSYPWNEKDLHTMSRDCECQPIVHISSPHSLQLLDDPIFQHQPFGGDDAYYVKHETITIVNELSDTDKMPFGKHKGEPMQDVPARYLHWLWTNGIKDNKESNVGDYIRRNLDELEKEYSDGIWD